MGNSWCELLSLSGLTDKRKIMEVGFTSRRRFFISLREL